VRAADGSRPLLIPDCLDSRRIHIEGSSETLASRRPNGSLSAMGERPERVPSLAEGAIDRGRRTVAGLADGFRKAGRWQRIRLGVVGSWMAVSLLALWIAYPSSGPGNSLGADVHVLKNSLLGGQQILVRNESDAVWTDVVLTLDDSWRNDQRTVRPHEQVVLSPAQFDRSGEPAPRDLRPRKLSIECREGRAHFELR